MTDQAYTHLFVGSVLRWKGSIKQLDKTITRVDKTNNLIIAKRSGYAPKDAEGLGEYIQKGELLLDPEDPRTERETRLNRTRHYRGARHHRPGSRRLRFFGIPQRTLQSWPLTEGASRTPTRTGTEPSLSSSPRPWLAIVLRPSLGKLIVPTYYLVPAGAKSRSRSPKCPKYS